MSRGKGYARQSKGDVEQSTAKAKYGFVRQREGKVRQGEAMAKKDCKTCKWREECVNVGEFKDDDCLQYEAEK